MEAGRGLRALRATVFAAVCVLLAALGHAVMSGTGVPWWAVTAAVLVTGGAAWAVAGRERGPLLITAATVGAQSALHLGFTFAQKVTAGAVAGAPGAVRAVAGSGRVHHTGHLAHASAHAHAAVDTMAMHAAPTHSMTSHAAMGHAAMGHDAMGHAATGHTAMGHDAMSHSAMGNGVVADAVMGHGALGMWSAHVLVALLCGMWLSGGEQAAFRLFRLVRTRAVRLFAPLLALLPGGAPPPGPVRPRAAREGTAQRLRRLLLVHVIATRGPPVPSAVPAR
ncbi:hypothetical protein [Streptomyces cucumeris]|uniref:hypothetical protein n=1 Tax=Streptomyces cucumeris TaxID=2962890 RepID=UPI0020C8CCA5|nr:hypothetical protein [Streptomyces sp. NEAU-Y11]MCP9207963.1 hypothetical protein [Streptomyces sp. NEAU-Y11]